jgi:hypothetical protein
MLPEQILLVVVISILAALAVGRIFKIMDLYKQVQELEANPPAPCARHEWVYVDDNKLGCRVCGFRPSEYQ